MEEMDYAAIEHLAAGMNHSGDLARDVVQFFVHHGAPETAAHSTDVARKAREIAVLAGADPSGAEQAALLHDISGVIPSDRRLSVAQAWALPVLAEEAVFPMIIHQKLSVVIARSIFHIRDEEVLSAIGCHTTLRAAPSTLDKVVFIADKIRWDQAGEPPYLDSVQDALRVSLDQSVFTFLAYVWARRDQLRVIHPWLRDAYMYFAASMGGE